MSALFNQTNIASYTTNFITRKEVADGFSTLAGDLSGVNLSTLFLNPNPIVSTLTMNPSGLLSGYAPAQHSQVNFSTQQAIGLTNIFNYTGAMTAKVDGGSNTAPFVGLGFKAQLLQNTNNQTRIDYNFNQIAGTPDGATFASLATYNPGVTNPPWVLSNVSTINGIPPNTTGTTFTSLTGSNLTTTGTLTSPQIVSVSSINGVPYSAVFNGTWTGSQSVSLNSNVVGVLATINLPAGYLQPNQTYIYDVPIVFTSMPPGQPTGFLTNIGIRLGGNGQINYQVPFYILNSSQGFSISLTGIAQTNSITVAGQTIQILGVQAGTPTFTATWSAPTSTGGLNVFSIKPLS